MASLLKLSVSVDSNNSSSNSLYEPQKKLNFVVKSLPFSSSSHVIGTYIVNPFHNLKHIRVSRLDTDISQPHQTNFADDDAFNQLNSEVSERHNFDEDSPNKKLNIWKRFRGGGKLGEKLSKYDTGDEDLLREINFADDAFHRSNRNVRERHGFKKHLQKRKPNVLKRFGRDGKEGARISKYEKEEEKPMIYLKEDVHLSDIGAEMSVERCNVILRQLERGRGRDSEALGFFEWMRENGKLKHNVTAYKLVLRVLGRSEDWKGAELLIKEMTSVSGCELSCQVFNTLIYACCKGGLVELSSKWLRMMLENGVQPDVATFGMLMSLYQKCWAVEEAEFTFSQMRELRIVCRAAYSAMITIYTRLGLYDRAEEIIGFLRDDKVAMNMENWLVLLNAYCQQGKLSKAEQILVSMREEGLPLNIVAYNTMITGHGKVSNMDAAEGLFQNLAKIGLEPDETTYRSMIEGWGRANNYKKALWYYGELKRLDFQPNSSNLYTMINLQAKHEDDESAIRTIDDMIMIGCQKSSVLGILLQAYEKAERLDRVPQILKGSLYDHVLKNQISCSILVMAYAKSCLIDDALEVLKQKRWCDPIFEDNLYHLLICSCKEMGHLENAVRIFSHMPNSDKPNLHITCTMIDIYSMMNLFTKAENLYLKLKSSGVALDMIGFSIVVRMYVKSGSLREACSVLEAMEKQKSIVPDNYLLRDMLRIYQRCSMLDKLTDLYYKILKTGVVWDQEMYNCVINCCARALPVDELSRLFEEMLQRGFAPNTITLNVMLDVYGKSGLLKKARRVFWMAKKQGLLDVISYNTLIAAYGQNKDLKNMSSTANHMQFNGFSVSLEAYNCMLDAYGKASEMEKFRNVLMRMKELRCTSDQYTYNIMINIYGEQGWIEEVAAVLMELKQSGLGPDLCSYNTLIKAYGIAGMVEEAVSVVKEMRENGIQPDRITYRNLIAALQKNDKFLEAVKWSLWMKQVGL